MRFIAILLVVISVFFSCRKEKPKVPDAVKPAACWQKFIGTYMVYDTVNLTSWQMQIYYTTDTNINTGYVYDCLRFNNFDNNFVFKFQFNCYSLYPEDPLYTGISYTSLNVQNYSGKRYNIHFGHDNISTSYLENNLKNDTIVFYFRKENLQYYFDDGVPYEDAYHTHIAVKQY